MVTQPPRGPAWAIVAVSLALIAFMTLRPTSAIVITPTLCIVCGDVGGVDFALNVVLFVPLGIGLRWAIARWQTAAAIGMVTTLAIESLQWRLIPGRDASFGDLLANTLGTMVGAWIAVEGIRWLNANSLAARRYAAVFGLLATATFCASAWLLKPMLPWHPYWVQWTPERPNTDVFQGRLLTVQLDDKPIHPTEMLLSTQVFDTSRSVSVRVLIGLPVPPTRRQAVIVRLANPVEEALAVAQWGEAAVFRTHMSAVRVKLRPLHVGLDDALAVSNTAGAGTAGEISIEASSSPRAMIVRRLHPSGDTSVTLRRTVGLAWALFMPWDVALGPRWWAANAFWLGALVLPVTFFTVRSGGSAKGAAARRMAWWPLPLVLATLVAGPVTGLAALSIGEWFGVLAGIVAGMILERATATPAREDLKGLQPDGTILT